MQEERWLAALQRGELEWFPELVEAYQHRIYALSVRHTRNTTEAEDLAQEIFLHFYRKINQFRGESQLSTWLYRVALNKAASYMRKRRWPLAFTSSAPGVSDDSPGAEQVILRYERHAQLHMALAHLHTRDREVLELFYFQELSTQRIAQILQLAPRSVETRLYRARERLKPLLSDYFEEVEPHGTQPGRVTANATKPC